jgi:hypothetical protein
MPYDKHKRRRKIKVQAKALEDAEVTHVSIVTRGANRIPFRVFKSEDGMINLANLFVRKSEPKAPTLAAVITPVEKAEAMAQVLKDQGYSVTETTKKDEEGIALLSLVEKYDESAVTAFKMSEDAVVLIENVEKAFRGFIEGTDFNDNMKQAGFFPGMHMASNVLMDTVHNILMEDGEASEVVGKIDEALDAFHQNVLSMAQSIPAEAFKMELLTLPTEQAEETTEKADDSQESEEETVEKGGLLKGNTAEDEPAPKKAAPKKAKPKAQKDEDGEIDTALGVDAEGDDGEATAKTEEESATESSEEGEDAVKADSHEALVEALTQKMGEAIVAAVTPITESVSALTAKVESLETATAEVTETAKVAAEEAKAATEAVNGTVVGGETHPDTDQPKTPAKKSEGGMFDTAFRFDGFE